MKDKASIFTEKNHTVDRVADDLKGRIKEQIGMLPDQILVEFGKPTGILDKLDLQSSWRDKFSRNSWYDTWAKGGT